MTILLKQRKFELSEIEIKGLQLIADGYSGKEISDTLGKNVHYIGGNFRSNICNILGATNTYNAIAIAMRKGIIK